MTHGQITHRYQWVQVCERSLVVVKPKRPSLLSRAAHIFASAQRETHIARVSVRR